MIVGKDRGNVNLAIVHHQARVGHQQRQGHVDGQHQEHHIGHGQGAIAKPRLALPDQVCQPETYAEHEAVSSEADLEQSEYR